MASILFALDEGANPRGIYRKCRGGIYIRELLDDKAGQIIINMLSSKVD